MSGSDSMQQSDDGSSSSDSDSTVEEEEPEAASATSAGRQIPVCLSLWPSNRPSTVYFAYPLDAQRERLGDPPEFECLGSRRLNYRCAWERNCVKKAFAAAGFRRVRQEEMRKKESSVVSDLVDAVGDLFSTNQKRKPKQVWSASWSKHPTAETLASLNRFQKVNHFPGSWCVGRKDRLLRTITRSRRKDRQAYSYSPESYALPSEYGALENRAKLDPMAIWIVKPPAASCGRGIRLVQSRDIPKVVPREKKLVAQRYLDSPFLIDGRKFDLRIYVLQTSVDPLLVYIHDDGLVRFSTHPYTVRNLRCRYVHLTNYSVNKKSKNYGDEDCKWSLEKLWNWLRAHGHDADGIRKKISDLVVKTLVAAEADLTPAMARALRRKSNTRNYAARGVVTNRRTPPPKRPCFELFGFDVLLDADLTPWLIEVNVSPSLMGGSPLDRAVKTRLMADVFHVVGFEPVDSQKIKIEENAIIKSNQQQSRGEDRFERQRRCGYAVEDIDLDNLTEDDWDSLMHAEDQYHRAASSGFRRCWPPEPVSRPSRPGADDSGPPEMSPSAKRQRVAEILPLFNSLRFSDCLLAKAALTSPRTLYASSPYGMPSFLSNAPPKPREEPKSSRRERQSVMRPRETIKSAGQAEYTRNRRLSQNNKQQPTTSFRLVQEDDPDSVSWLASFFGTSEDQRSEKTVSRRRPSSEAGGSRSRRSSRDDSSSSSATPSYNYY